MDVDERWLPGESSEEYVLRVATLKADAGVNMYPGRVVLAADTAVVLGEVVFGKPVDAADATRMLRALSGKAHRVLTGVAVRSPDGRASYVEATTVWMAALTEEDLAWYVESGEPMDKAGAYTIQGLASRFVTCIEGSYSNVVGLPVASVTQTLARLTGEAGHAARGGSSV